VREIEQAMQEAIDQNVAVAYPAVGAPAVRVEAAHRQLVDRAQNATGRPSAAASAILRNGGRAVGVLSLERSEPFDAQMLALVELVATTTGPVIALKAQVERPVAGALADAAWKGVRAVFGPRRPALKLLVVMVALGMAGLWIATGPFRVTAKAVLEGEVQRAAVAPFQGFISRAPFRAGDIVKAGDVLAQLDDADLRLERLKAESELQKLNERERDALAKHDRTTIGVTAAEIAQAEAQLKLVDEKLARTNITAPIDGLIISGDLSHMLGSPIEQGKVLFEIAPLDRYRLALQVDEGDIGFVAPGLRGSLVLTGESDVQTPFVLEKTTSVSTPQEGRNYFRVEARLGDTSVALRPGMEGVGKIDIGERRLIWVWFRTLLSRLRLLVWTWAP
jgi:multidrug efflux pump subunit AcrA (membrane-fusion protein)